MILFSIITPLEDVLRNILEWLHGTSQLIKASPPEDVFQLNFDLFRFAGPSL